MTPTLLTAVGLLIVCALVSTAFPVIYAWDRWDQVPRWDQPGRYVMALSVCLALMLDFTVAGLLWARVPVWASLALYPALTALMSRLVFLVVRQHRQRPPKEGDHDNTAVRADAG